MVLRMKTDKKQEGYELLIFSLRVLQIPIH